MKLNLKKLTVFALSCAISAGSISQGIQANTTTPSELTQQEHDVLHALNNKICTLTIRAKFLVNKIENPNDPDKLDVIVRKMQSLEPSVVALIDEILVSLDRPDMTEGIFHKTLNIKLEIVNKLHSILNKLATILESGLRNAVPKKDISPNAIKFWNQIKGPLAPLASPAELNYFENKLSELHSIIEEISLENSNIIKELIFLLNKIRVITESTGSKGKSNYLALSKKLPSKRAPFAGIPAKIDLEDWIGEVQENN